MLDCFFDEITAKVVENKLWYRLNVIPTAVYIFSPLNEE